MAIRKRRDRAPVNARTVQLVNEVHDRMTHRIRLGRRINQLLDELDCALQLYNPHVRTEDEQDVARFRHELSRIRGGENISAPILVETAAPEHVERAAFAIVADHARVPGSALEEMLGRSRGYANKAKLINVVLPANAEWCERCAERARVDAAVNVLDGSRRVMERQALCVDCYETAITVDD